MTIDKFSSENYSRFCKLYGSQPVRLRRAKKPLRRASKPLRRASKPLRRANKPLRRATKPLRRAIISLRRSNQSLRSIGSPESRVFILVALARVNASNWFNIMTL